MSAAPHDRADIRPRWFGPITWISTIVMAIAFSATPPYPSTGRGWMLRVVFAIVVGFGAGLTEVWANRRQDRKRLAELDGAVALRPLPKARS